MFRASRSVVQEEPPLTLYSILKSFCAWIPPSLRVPSCVQSAFRIADWICPDTATKPAQAQVRVMRVVLREAVDVVEPCPVFVLPVTADVPACPGSGVVLEVGYTVTTPLCAAAG